MKVITALMGRRGKRASGLGVWLVVRSVPRKRPRRVRALRVRPSRDILVES